MYLCFIDDADDAACYPADRLVAMTVASDATLVLHFESNINDANEQDVVTLTVTSDKEKDVMLAIAKQVEKGGTLLVADDVNSVYCHKDITACAITLDS